MLFKAFVMTLCLLKLTSTVATASCECYNSCSFKIDETIEPLKTMLRSSSINGKKFVLVTMQQTNWYRAAHICKYNGKQLAIINSPEEQNVITQLIDKSGLSYDGFWTSGNNLDCHTDWYWLSNGKPIEYFSWKVGEPNNLANTNERCMNLMPKCDNYKWNDAPCDYSKYYFICEEECGCNKPKA